MKICFPLMSIFLTLFLNEIKAQTKPSNQQVSNGIKKMVHKSIGGEYLNFTNTTHNIQNIKTKTTGVPFQRVIASDLKRYDNTNLVYTSVDSNVYHWNKDNGENVNLIKDYNNTFHFSSGMLNHGIDFNNLENVFLQNIYHVNFDKYPVMDSVNYYYYNNFSHKADIVVDNNKNLVDSLFDSFKHYKFIYDANDNITKRIGYFGNGQIASLDTIIYSASNKKISHYQLDNDISPARTLINKYAYDANDEMIMASYEYYSNNAINYAAIDSFFNLSAAKDSIVSYVFENNVFKLDGIKINYKSNGYIDSTHHFKYDNGLLGIDLLYYTRNASNNITELAFLPFDADTFVLFKSYTNDEQIASSHIGVFNMGYIYYYFREEFEYNAEGNILKFLDYDEYNYATSAWEVGINDTKVDFYYELYAGDDTCALTMNYNRIAPNDSLCSDYALVFLNETLPINIQVTSVANPTPVNYTITTLPFILPNFCPGTYTITAEDNKSCTDTLLIAVQDLTSTNNIDISNQIKIYPNPAKDVVHIDGLTTGAQLTLIDMFGRTLQNVVVKSKNYSFNVAKLPSGIYTVQINVNGTIANRKIVINR